MNNEVKNDDCDLRRRIGRNVERLRGSRGLSRSEFGQLIGRPETAVVAIEAGKGRLMVSDLAFLSVVLDVSPAELLASPEDGISPFEE